jgi:hypothetical protein
MAKILRNIDQIIDTQGNELSIANPVEVPQQLESFRNRFINGNMQVHQRGNGTATAGTFTYATDRWYVYCVGEGCSYSQVDTPTGKALEVIPDSGTTNQIIAQKIENVNCLELGGKTVTISGKVYIDDVTGVTFNTNIYSASSTNASYGSKVDFSSDLISGEYAYFSEQVTLPADAVNGVEVDFSFLNAGGRTIHVTDLQFEEGTVATPFEHRPYGLELSLCQRYCQKLRKFELCKMREYDRVSTGTYQFVTEMRAAPTIPARTQNPDNLSVTVNEIDTLGFNGSLNRPTDGYGGTVNGGGVANAEL